MTDRIDELERVVFRSYHCTTCDADSDDAECEECAALSSLVTIAREAIAERDALKAQRDWIADSMVGCPPGVKCLGGECCECWIDAAKEATK